MYKQPQDTILGVWDNMSSAAKKAANQTLICLNIIKRDWHYDTEAFARSYNIGDHWHYAMAMCSQCMSGHSNDRGCMYAVYAPEIRNTWAFWANVYGRNTSIIILVTHYV